MYIYDYDHLPLVPAGVAPIPASRLKIINSDPHRQKEKGLIPLPTPRGEVMWVHPDIMEDQQWTTVNRKKSRGKGKAPCNVVSVSSKETEMNTASLTNSEEERTVFIVGPEIQPISVTRSGKQYLKNYNEAEPSNAKPIEEVVSQPPKKAKEPRFSKPLRPNNVEGPSAPFNFDVLAQLANIPARITLYELLRLSKTTRKALREALADSEAFLAQVPATVEEESKPRCLRCDQVVRPI